MTLSTTTNKVSYAGDGSTTAFSVPFLFLENAHIEAVLRDSNGSETTWTENTEYTLSGAGNDAGGTLTVSTSPTDYTPASGETLVIRRVVPETQETDYPDGGAFPASAHEQALDKLTMLVQQHSEELARTVKFTETSSESDVDLADRGASKVLATDASKNLEWDAAIREDGSDGTWDAESKILKNLTTPASDQDAATKKFVQDSISTGGNVPGPANPADDNKFLKASGGAFSWQDLFGAANTWTATQKLELSGIPIWATSRTDTGAATQVIGRYQFIGEDDAGSTIGPMVAVEAEIVDPSAASMDTEFNIYNYIAGAYGRRWRFAQGLYSAGATGGDKGVDTLNAEALYDAGDRVLAQGLHTIWVPAAAMVARSTNGAASGLVELASNDAMLKTFDYDPSTNEAVQFSVAMPKSWDEGTFTCEFLWTAASGSGAVDWRLRGHAVGDDDALDTSWGTAVAAVDTLIAANDLHVSAVSPAFTPAGTAAEGDMIVFEAWRNAAGGGDTLAVDAKLIGIRLFYTLDAKNDA